MVCNYCKKNGHIITKCPILAEVTCSRCNGKGHNKYHCKVSEKDLHFPLLSSGSTPRHTGSRTRHPGSRTRHSGSTPHIPGSTPSVAKSSSYEDAVKRVAEKFISQVRDIAGRNWFQIYPLTWDPNDNFLRCVNDYIRYVVRDCEDSQIKKVLDDEAREWETEEEEKTKRAKRVMSPEEYEDSEEECLDEEEPYYLYECRLNFMDYLEHNKKKVEEFLVKMEETQIQRSYKKCEQGRILRSSDERPRHTLWSAIHEKM